MNKNYKLRDKIIFGKYDPKAYLGGCRNFRCSYETMEKLVDENFVELDECQNYSPYTKDFMETLKDIQGVTFIAYAISPDRDDYRITIEGFDAEISDTDFDNISMLVELFHYADEFNFEHSGNKFYMHAWWD